MALNLVDKLLAAYIGFVTLIILGRGPFDDGNAWLLLVHGLLVALLFLFTRLQTGDRVGRVLHTIYPLLLLFPLYTEIGILNTPLGLDAVLANDAVIQRWETAVFGGQLSYTWIRQAPSVFWSAVLHVAYFSYYPIVTIGPLILVALRRQPDARNVVLVTMVAYLSCYVVFVVFPVGGPYYAFDSPTGPVRDVWSARVVYNLLEGGSSVGAAFPSSHVAATIAATLALWKVWRPLALTFAIPAILLTVGTVYCQMHYAIDASVGGLVGVASALLGLRFAETRSAITSPG